MTGPLDGVRPKNAICTRCGYQFGGVAIRDSVIVCPECGESVRFELVPPKCPAASTSAFTRVHARGLAVGVLAAGAVMVSGMMGLQGWRRVAAAGISVYVVVLVVAQTHRAWQRWIGG